MKRWKKMPVPMPLEPYDHRRAIKELRTLIKFQGHQHGADVVVVQPGLLIQVLLEFDDRLESLEEWRWQHLEDH